MTRKGKFSIYMLCMLILLSIYKDLTREGQKSADVSSLETLEVIHDTHVVRRTVQPGDTLLSVMEEIHAGHNTSLHSEHVVKDFKKLNVGVDPYALILYETYYFPVYTY